MADPIGDTVSNAGKTTAAAAKGGLGKQLGPLPVGVWIAIVGGGLVISFYLANKNTKKGGTDNTDTTQPGALVYTGVGGNDGTSDDPDKTTTAGFQTNEAWAQAAKNYLISQGVDAKEASDAVDLYINAQALNNKQNAMISTVTRALGAPPQSLPPVTGTPPPSNNNDPNSNPSVWGTTPRQNPQSLVGTVYVTQADNESLVSIAKKAFGLAPSDYSSMTFASNEILNANHNVITDVTHIPKGTKLYIPVLSSQDFPGFGQYVPQFGYPATGGKSSTGEWQIDTGAIPNSANIARSLAHRQS